jgi:hypothetical protein
MTSSDVQEARLLLEALEGALDPRELRETIEMPLEAAAEPFLQPRPRPTSSKIFNQQITDFVTDVYSTASQGKRLLPRAEAFAISVQALDDASGLPARRGYELALLSAVQDGSQEMSAVLGTILEGLKQRERAARFRWVCVRFLETLDWGMKCSLVAAIIQVHHQKTGVELLPGDPARFAGDLPDLLAAFLESAHAVQTPASTELKH